MFDSGNTMTTSYENRLGGYRGERSSCADVVTPSFKERSAAGEIINNPFTRVVDVYDWGGVGPVVDYIGSTNPWPVGTTDVFTHTTVQLHVNTAFLYYSSVDDEQIVIPPSIVDVEKLLVKAKTAALARVDASVATSLVSIGQAKQTILSIFNPLASIRKYLQRWNVNSAGKLMRKSGDGFVLASANEYLAFYYGLIPLVNDVKNIMSVANNELQTQKRATARGSATGTKTTVNDVYGNRGLSGTSWFDLRYTRVDTVTVRSGILYIPTMETVSKQLGLRLSDAPFAILDLVPWSFLVDYFINLSSFVQALSPRVGVTYLSSWDTVEYFIDYRSETLGSGVGGTNFVHTRVGNEWSTRSIRAVVRTPSAVYDNVGLTISSGNWTSFTKIAAVLALTIQQLGKFGPAMRFLKTAKTVRPGAA
jgi:hypothetical protein